jgi:ubiquinone/menaquinone biosynthesis C-methylase UbiE
MMNSYNEFAAIYDIFMEEVDYDAWSSYVTKHLQKNGIDRGRILDTACGTGNITIPLSKKGYEIWGLDISEDMLSIAESKARASKQKIKFLRQNMTQMVLKERFDAVLCMCDGVNYITEEEGLAAYFAAVYRSLDKKGIFIFDISSYYKIHNILGNNTFHEEKNNMHYIWNNNFDEASGIIEMNLIFFVPEESLYKKFEEYHVQRAYRESQLEKLLKNAGFSSVSVYGEFGFCKPMPDSERIFFVAAKE